MFCQSPSCSRSAACTGLLGLRIRNGPHLVAARKALQDRSAPGSVRVAVRNSDFTVSTDATSARCGHIQSVAQTARCRARCARVPAARAATLSAPPGALREGRSACSPSSMIAAQLRRVLHAPRRMYQERGGGHRALGMWSPYSACACLLNIIKHARAAASASRSGRAPCVITYAGPFAGRLAAAASASTAADTDCSGRCERLRMKLTCCDDSPAGVDPPLSEPGAARACQDGIG